MKRKPLKFKEIESILSRKIQNIYQAELEKEPENITYKLFNRTLIVTMEGIVTSSERLLRNNNRLELAEQVRQAVDSVIHPQIQDTIEEVLNVKIVDFLSDTTIKSDLTGAIAIFEAKLEEG
ncbi:MAG: DUF2294 domain-containing protein [Cyanobacteria bacterium P01_G01_bin.19]